MSNQKDYSEDDFDKMGFWPFYSKLKEISTDANVSIRDVILPLYQTMGVPVANRITTGLILLHKNVEELRISSFLRPDLKFTVPKLLNNSKLSNFCIIKCEEILLRVSPEWDLEVLEKSSESSYAEFTFSFKSEDELRGILELRYPSSRTPLFKTDEFDFMDILISDNRAKSKKIRKSVEDWDIEMYY
jgi:hypothetical protein